MAAKWVTGLRSPKGIHRRGEDLLVADVGQVVIIDVAGARIRQTIDLDPLGAKFPNDVTVDDRSGDAYVSDMLRNTIYRIPAGGSKAEVWLESGALDGPNGLFLDGDRLMVASRRGRIPTPGRILVVDVATKAGRPAGRHGAPRQPRRDREARLRLDRYRQPAPSGGSRPTARPRRSAKIANAADLGLRRGDRVAAVPTLSDNTVVFLTLP